MRIFISTGEASGDAYGAALVRELREAVEAETTLCIEAAGGSRLRVAGAHIVCDTSTWGAIGIAQSLKVLPRALQGIRKIRDALSAGKPGLFVPIDFGYMNVKLAKFAKARGWKVLYFIPPGSWRKDRQGDDLPKVCDEIVTPFFWSAELLRKMGARAHCFGHPAKQLVKRREKELIESGHEDRVNLAILPGSRSAEIDLLLPLLADVVRDDKHVVEFAVAPNFCAEDLRARWLKLVPNRTGDLFTEGDTYGVLYRARAAIVCSGTATLEAALCVCPHVVVYKVGPLMEMQARAMGIKGQFISQPNILLGKAAVPELIQQEATAVAIRSKLDSLLAESDERRKQIWDFMELDSLCGPDDAITQTAMLARSMLEASASAVAQVDSAVGSLA